MDFVNQPQEPPLTWFDEEFCLIFRLQEFIGRMTRNKDRYWIETDNVIDSTNITKHLQTEGIKATQYPIVKTPQSTVEIQVFPDLKYIPLHKPFVGNQNHYIQHNMTTFLLHIQMVLIRILDSQNHIQ